MIYRSFAPDDERQGTHRKGGVRISQFAQPTMALELALVLTIIAAALVALFSCVGCCVVRCFRPENSRGSLWFPDEEGKPQRVVGVWEKREPGDDKKRSWLREAEKE